MKSNPDFSKMVCFTDIHLGLRNNNRDHNDSCERFIKWMIEEAKSNAVKTCIFLGDWHHVRSAINISTLNYSVSCLKLLNDNFDHVFFIIGNHDLFYRDKYEIHSLPYITQFPNIVPVDKILQFPDIAIVPWLVGDEWKKMKSIKAKYIFGHFEIPGYLMNAMIQMPDHGTINKNDFNKNCHVFSGHFHKRQTKDNITYIGNTFPHNYADAWDDDRGLMFLSFGKEPIFKSWPDAPKYRTMTLSQVLLDPDMYVDNKTFARITIDVNASYEDINFVRELLEKELGAKEIHMITGKEDDIVIDDDAEIIFESVDTIVLSHLQSIESNTIDKNELISIYQDL